MNSDKKVICPECLKQGLKSKVYITQRIRNFLSTLEYYDEDGNYCLGRIPALSTYYTCSNGHSWIEEMDE